MHRIRLLLYAYVLPGLAVYLAYAGFVYFSRLGVFGRVYANQYFRRDFLDNNLRFPLRDPDLVILGESGAKVGFDPRLMDQPFTINLSILYGNSLSHYQTMVSYLERRKAPPCIALLSQYEWKRSYFNFFGNLVKQGAFTTTDMLRIWEDGKRHALFPQTHFNILTYWGSFFLQSAYLYEIDFRRLQLALRRLTPRLQMRRERMKLEEARGHVSWNNNKPKDDTAFFGEVNNVALLTDFVPSPTEDHYLKELASLAQHNRILMLVGETPVAESLTAEKNAPFRRQRSLHLRQLLREFKSVHFLDMPATLPRENFFDFTHANSKGAKILSKELSHQVRGLCVSGE